MSPLFWLLLIPGLIISFFQLVYLVLSFKVRIEKPSRVDHVNKIARGLSIIIPVYGDEATIANTLKSILRNAGNELKTVVVVLDRCNEQTSNLVNSFIEHFSKQAIPLIVKALPEEKYGKVQALIYGGEFVQTKTVLLLDSDIVLEKDAISTLFYFHIKEGGPFSSCLIYPFDGTAQAHSLSQRIVCNNRLYRQSVIQTVKNLYGCSNFPGGVQMVDFIAYKDLLVHGFLEDLTATYSVLKSGGKISILPVVLAYEIERQTIWGMFLQRIRWTIGAIQHIPVQVAAAKSRKKLIEKILINSYHVMWEIQYYIIIFNLLLIFIFPSMWYLLFLPMVLYMCNIFRSVALTWENYRNSLFAALLHCIVHPIIISVALPSSIILVLFKGSFSFKSKSLFRRI